MDNNVELLFVLAKKRELEKKLDSLIYGSIEIREKGCGKIYLCTL